MQKSIIRIFVLSFLVSLLLGFNWSLFFGKSTVRAVGDLAVDWGVVEGNPIFTVDNFTPGSEEVREVKIVNNAESIRPVGVRGIENENLGGLSDKLLLTVSEDEGDIYHGKLADFFKLNERMLLNIHQKEKEPQPTLLKIENRRNNAAIPRQTLIRKILNIFAIPSSPHWNG